MWLRDAGRAAAAWWPSDGLTLAKIAFLAVAGIAVVAICNINRGNFLPIIGVPWVVPLVFAVVGGSTVLERLSSGATCMLVGGTRGCPRPASALTRSRNLGLRPVLGLADWAASSTSQLAASRPINTGGQYVLFAVAAAVIVEPGTNGPAAAGPYTAFSGG